MPNQAAAAVRAFRCKRGQFVKICDKQAIFGSAENWFMVTTHLIPHDIRALYEVAEWRNAAGILATANPVEWAEIHHALRSFRLLRSEIMIPGGRRSLIVERVEVPLKRAGWKEKEFVTEIVVDGKSTPSPTHKVDCFKNRVALEVEWNNKDPFFDRDLNNFRLLFDLRVIDAGLIITRADHLQQIFDALGRGSSYGSSTTHMERLLRRVNGGGGGGCPILVFGITKNLYIEDIHGESGPADAEDSRSHSPRDDGSS